MFSFVKERKALAALAAISPGAEAAILATTPPERAAALAVANAMLLAGATQWGRAFSHAPMRLGRETACDAVCVLADRHATLEIAAGDLSGRPPSDPQISACRWEIAATQAVIVTAGASLGREHAAAAKKVWAALGMARRHADEGVKALLQHARAYSAPPIPETTGRKADKAYLTALASSMPPMFRPKAS